MRAKTVVHKKFKIKNAKSFARKSEKTREKRRKREIVQSKNEKNEKTLDRPLDN